MLTILAWPISLFGGAAGSRFADFRALVREILLRTSYFRYCWWGEEG
jgi:hypothetical protein